MLPLVQSIMPSTRRQKAEARKSREMDMMSDIDNLDVMLRNRSENSIERELADAIEQSSVQGDYEGNEYQMNNYIFVQEKELMRHNEVRPLKLLQLNSTSDCLKKWIP